MFFNILQVEALRTVFAYIEGAFTCTFWVLQATFWSEKMC